ncbi:MAG TPA: hypothetical protein VFJ65_08475 [Solirubrobacterales bacterium]|nr:hypothetical protein [Solirubrobacterales bacterium]
MHVMARETWTDERLDDLKEHMDEGFREVRADLNGLRNEVTSLRAEVGKVREGQGELRAELKALNRTLQIGFGLTGSFLIALVGLIGTRL